MVACTGWAEPPKDDPKNDDLKPASEAFIAMLAKGEYDKAVDRFDATMKGALPAEKLRAVWEGLQGQVGRFAKSTGADQTREDRYRVVFVKCEFEKAVLEAKLAYDDEGKIAGLFFLPPRPETADYRPPSYARPDLYTESEVAVGPLAGGLLGPEAGPLPGTLLLPRGAGPFPGVVLVHGSGPLDRDETIGPNRPFRDLAVGLGSRGIAVLRYDKRSQARPASLRVAGDRLTLHEEAIADVLAAVASLRRTDSVDPDRVFVLGHSLGGIAAVRAGHADRRLAGLILLAAPGRPLEDHLPEQLAYIFGLDGTLSEDDLVRLDAARRQAGNVKNLGTTPAADLPLGLPASYWDDLRRHPATGIIRAIRTPVLVLQGGRDYQVTEDDFAAWRRALEGRPRATLRTYPSLNHLFMEGTGRSTPDEYGRTGHVAAAVIEDVAAWIGGLTAGPIAAAGAAGPRVNGTV
jgi:hypothetical protein